ncbi:hypothetical protein GCM10027047_29300 [Rhodococcus aerolatus]
MSQQDRATAPAATPGPSRAAGAAPRTVPEATVSRFAVYLRVLGQLSADDVATVSSEQLAALAGVGSAKLRKDLSFLGSTGTRGVGYDVDRLRTRLEHTLGATRRRQVAVVGVGNLGAALAGYDGFGERGFPVAALFDADPARVGALVGGTTVHHVDELAPVCHELGVDIGVVATPAESAQDACDRLVAAGVRCILTFAPVPLAVPDAVEVRRVDLAAELQVLSFHVARREAGPAPAPPPAHPSPRAAGARPAGPRPARSTTRRNGPVIVP